MRARVPTRTHDPTVNEKKKTIFVKIHFGFLANRTVVEDVERGFQTYVEGNM